MTIPLFSVLFLLGLVIAMFAVNRPRMDAVALIAMCALPLTGVVTVPETLAGFSDPNIVLIAALFVIGEGLVRTGVAKRMGEWLVHHGGNSHLKLIALMMLSVGFVGSIMSSTAITAIFIPVLLTICRRTGLAPSQLMMPLSFAALISGMMTLVATAPNLVINTEVIRAGHKGFQFFSFTPFGLPILVLGTLYMMAVSRWLPKRSGDPNESSASEQVRPTLSDWVRRYALAEREYRLMVLPGSPLSNQTLDSLNLRSTRGANIVAIQRGRQLIQPMSKTILHEHDVVYLDLFSSQTPIDQFQEDLGLKLLPLNGPLLTDHSQDIGMAEMFVPADSGLIGKTTIASQIRARFGFSVIGLRRGPHALKENIVGEVLKVGDTLLVIGPWRTIRNARAVGGDDLLPLNLPMEIDEVLPAPEKLIHAVVILLGVVILMVSGIIPNVQAALIGCLLMGAMNCIDFKSAYRAIDWKTLILIVGMLPFSTALQRTGGVELAADFLMSTVAQLGNYSVLATLFVMTSLLGMFISNTATAVLMGPLALSISDQMQVSPYPLAMIVALGASSAFMTPVSSPVNTMVVTPGNYLFGDFVRFGVPFTILVMVVSVLIVPILLPF